MALFLEHVTSSWSLGNTDSLSLPNSEYSVAQLGFMVREVEEILGRDIDVEEWRRL
ncbi:MAG: hypothetical protein ABIO92_00115 [Chloroflexia bacterium]